MANYKQVSGGYLLRGGGAAQFMPLTGLRVNATAAVTSTTEAALPAGAQLIMCRATGPMAIRFGNAGMGAAAVDLDSVLFPSGEAPIAIPLHTDGTAFTLFRVIRASGSDAFVQLESVALVS
jgi:hypothetical protein